MQNEPDREEKAIRFGCGALIGVPIAFRLTGLFFRHFHFSTARGLFVLGVMLTCGYLAMKKGDRFWENRWW